MNNKLKRRVTLLVDKVPVNNTGRLEMLPKFIRPTLGISLHIATDQIDLDLQLSALQIRHEHLSNFEFTCLHKCADKAAILLINSAFV
jgi:hypothetical protein